MIRILSLADALPFLERAQTSDPGIAATVRQIIEDVGREGDSAVQRYARKLDAFKGDSLLVAPAEIDQAGSSVDSTLSSAIRTAATNIRAVASRQLPQPWQQEFSPGREIGQIVRPLHRVGAYVPSGRYPLVSTLLMTVIPAQVARVKEIVVTTPHPGSELLAAAALIGQKKIYRLGGAHAIAALALGTETIPKVDRIVGPGNVYVAEAKRQLAGEVSIDFVAGPTEVVIISREGNPRWIAADMLAQAEHDANARAVLLTTSSNLANAVARELDLQLAALPTANVARVALEQNSAIMVLDEIHEAVAVANRLAPEHLSIDSDDLLEKIENAGTIFIGPHTPEAAGDYATGSNHVLPTAGQARFRGGLSAAHFVKTISVQRLSEPALTQLTPTIVALARAEGLEAHARSVEVRKQ